MEKIKSNGGYSGIEIAISLGIISITLVILAALYFNMYIGNIEIERRTQALNYASQIFEKVSEYYYSEVTPENFAITQNSSGNNEVAGIEIPKSYEVLVNIQNYKTNEATDVVKNVQITITYKVGNKDNTITLNRFKTKEVLITPNKPILEDNMTAVKVQKTGSTSTYKTTTTIDSDWYNYFQKRWALAKDNSTGNEVVGTDLFVWIPRYAYYLDSNQNLNIEFLYADKNQKVDEYGNLVDISSEYIVDSKFSGDNKNGYWIKISEIENDETAKRLNNSQYGNLIY